jgi:hypothetical protein
MRRHGFDPLSLVFGAIFAGVGLVFLFSTIDISSVPPAWSWPIPLMLVGALIIVLAARRERPSNAEPPAAFDTPPTTIVNPPDDPESSSPAADAGAQ